LLIRFDMTAAAPYEVPTIRDLGDLTQITADVHHVTMGVAAGAALVSSPMTPGGGDGGGGGGTPGGEVQTATAGQTPTADATRPEDTGTGFGSPGDSESDSPGTTGTVNVGTSGEWPFTGFPAALVALLGGLMSSVGIAIRRSMRRGSE